jgi:hypothetical protein
MEVDGIQFIVNTRGEKTAVVIDLIKHSQVWEEFYDFLVAESRRGEPTQPREDVKRELGLG